MQGIICMWAKDQGASYMSYSSLKMYLKFFKIVHFLIKNKETTVIAQLYYTAATQIVNGPPSLTH